MMNNGPQFAGEFLNAVCIALDLRLVTTLPITL